MSPTANSKKSTAGDKRLSQASSITRTPALEKPQSLRNNQNLVNLSQNQQAQKVKFFVFFIIIIDLIFEGFSCNV